MFQITLMPRMSQVILGTGTSTYIVYSPPRKTQFFPAHLPITIAGITDRCLFWFSVWGWGGYLGHKGGPGSVVIHGAFVCCLFHQKKYGVCLYKCPTIVMINRCGNETGKVCIFQCEQKFLCHIYTFRH